MEPMGNPQIVRRASPLVEPCLAIPRLVKGAKAPNSEP